MTGLADAYHDDVGALQSPLRLKAGAALLAVGTVLGLAALVAVLLTPADYGVRRIAGVLGGLAAPALVGGVVVILPANPRLRAAAAIGASITLLGVASFWHAYPEHWAGYGQNLTGYVTAVYFLGMLTLVCCCFAGIATLKRRNDPGGTVSLQVGEGETRVVKVRERVSGGLGGGVGLLGGTPDGDVETQTNRPDRGSSNASDSGDARSRTRSSRSGTISSGSNATTTGSSAGRTESSTGRTGSSAGSAPSSPGVAGSSSGSAAPSGGSTGFDSGSDGWGSDDIGSSEGSTQSRSLDAMSHSSSGGSSGSGSGTSGGSTGFSSGGLGSSGTASSDDAPSATRPSGEPRGAVSDGGATTDPVRDVEPASDAETGGGSGPNPTVADRYCGNCEHFQYARTERGMTPYCALNSEYMDDVEACEDWSSNA